MKKTYKQMTQILGIPVLGHRDRILPEVEMNKWKIVENMLIAGTQGVKKCVFDEGVFRVVSTSDELFSVTLSATGVSPSVEGMVGGAYLKGESQIVWPDLKKGNNYWLYLRGSRATFADPSSLRAVSSRHRLADSPQALLMAEVNFRELEPEVNPYPDGKIYTSDIAKHASDKENPHGKRLYQDELVVKHLILRDVDVVSTIEVDVDGEPKVFAASQLPEALGIMAGRAIEKVDFNSFGPDGGVIKLPSGKEILHVQVQRRVTGPFVGFAGETAVGYFGEDPHSDESSEFTVYNSGEEGLPMRALVWCK